MSGRDRKRTEAVSAARIDELVRAARNEAPPPAFVRDAMTRLTTDALVPPASGSLSRPRPSALAMAGKPLFVMLALCFAGATIHTVWSSTWRPFSRDEAPRAIASATSAPSTMTIVDPTATLPSLDEGVSDDTFDVYRLPSATTTAADRASGPPPMARRSERTGSTPKRLERSATNSSPDDFAIELARLRAARAALRSGRVDEATTILTQYEKSFPNGVLLPEAKAMRVDVLLAAGNIDAARTEAQTFVTSHPNSPQAARLRRLLDRKTNP